jgi:hypothetical protein
MRFKSRISKKQNRVSKEETANDGHAPTRPPLSLALVPLAILGITCGFSVVQRAAAAITDPEKYGQVFGNMTNHEAREEASLLCSQLTGSKATVTQVSRQCAYSARRQSMVREWNVLCDSSEGQYLIRINADTRRIYAVNRIDTSSEIASKEVSTSPKAPSLTEPIVMTRTVAEERARECLNIVGVSSQGLKSLSCTATQHQAPGTGLKDVVPQWNFTYRRSVPGLGERLLKVSINGETGSLEHVWNPVLAL